MLYQIQAVREVRNQIMARCEELTGEEPSQDDVGGIADLFARLDVTKCESFQSSTAVVVVDRGEREQYGPGYEPNGEKDDCHHSEEADVEISI